MVITLGEQSKVYTVKFTQAIGSQEMRDYTADGTSDAELKWRAEFPNAQLITIFRKK